MCFFSGLTVPVSELISHFRLEQSASVFHYEPSAEWNAFSFPQTPVITNRDPGRLQLFRWGLLPCWANENSFAKFTLNAKWESLSEKPSFRPYLNQRCLIPANVFYEWQWLDSKGKQKKKYRIQVRDESVYAYAGLWNRWIDPESGHPLHTYTIITQQANELMSVIHNSKQRMPLILRPENESRWLRGETLLPNEVQLVAEVV